MTRRETKMAKRKPTTTPKKLRVTVPIKAGRSVPILKKRKSKAAADSAKPEPSGNPEADKPKRPPSAAPKISKAGRQKLIADHYERIQHAEKECAKLAVLDVNAKTGATRAKKSFDGAVANLRQIIRENPTQPRCRRAA